MSTFRKVDWLFQLAAMRLQQATFANDELVKALSEDKDKVPDLAGRFGQLFALAKMATVEGESVVFDPTGVAENPLVDMGLLIRVFYNDETSAIETEVTSKRKESPMPPEAMEVMAKMMGPMVSQMYAEAPSPGDAFGVFSDKYAEMGVEVTAKVEDTNSEGFVADLTSSVLRLVALMEEIGEKGLNTNQEPEAFANLFFETDNLRVAPAAPGAIEADTVAEIEGTDTDDELN